MSSDADRIDTEDDPELTPPDARQDDAHVDEDVCVAALSAQPIGRRRRNRASMVAITISLAIHSALAAAWWRWGTIVTPPDFSIRAGIGGSPGTGTTDDSPAAELARLALPESDPQPPMARPDVLSGLEDDSAAPAFVKHDQSALADSLTPVCDMIGLGSHGWSPDIAPAIGHAKPVQFPSGQLEGNTSPPPPIGGTGGGGDGMALTGLSTKAAHDPPDYPEEARRRRWQGTVKLRMMVSVEGKVYDVMVVQSSGFAILDNSAVTKFSTYVVAPYRENGVAMESQVTVPVEFKLKDRSR